MILKKNIVYLFVILRKIWVSTYIITVGDHSIEISGLAQFSQLFNSPFQLSLQPAISSMLSFLSCHYA